jgi:hypothetical protein
MQMQLSNQVDEENVDKKRNMRQKSLMKILFSFVPLLVCLALTGCFASKPVLTSSNSKTDTVISKQAPLPSTNGGSNYKVAVTKPPVCNDFPVSFRVLLTDNEARVRPVQRTTLGAFSEDTFTYAPNN